MSFTSIQEAARRAATGDSWYVGEYPYALELVVNGGFSQVFVLPVGPEAYTVKRVFRQAVTPTLGGLVVEEQGLLWRDIEVSGSFALAPSLGYDTTGTPFVAGFKPEALVPAGNVKLSGPMWTKRLIRNVLEQYAAIKLDPKLGPGTYLVWHDFKMDDHWVVVPSEIGVARTTSRRMQYPYRLQLRTTGDADAIVIPPSKVSLIEKFRNAVGAVEQALDLGEAAILEGSQILGEVRYAAAQIDSVLDSYAVMLEAGRNFVEGVTATISVGATFVQSLAAAMEAQCALMEEVESLPASVRANYQNALDQVHAVGAQRSAFGTTYSQAAATQRAQETSTAGKASTAALEAAKAAGPPATAADMEARALRSTDADLGGKGDPAARTYGTYAGARDYTVGAGDTLQAIAAREMGDGALWYDLAIVNGLTAPYVSLTGAPGTVRPGDVIAVPTVSAAPASAVVTARSGSEPGEDLLGTNLRLVPSSRSRVGRPVVTLAIDRRTNQDLRLISGFANYQQALQMRLWTERGTLPLSPQYGLRSFVGYGSAAADKTAIVASFRETLLQDSRTKQVGRLSIEIEDDAITLEADVVPVGTAQAVSVAAFV